MQNPRSWAILSISGDFLPDEITKQMNLSPDYFHNRLNVSKKAFWQIHSKLAADKSLEEHLWELLRKISASRLAFKKIAASLDCVIYASVEFSDLQTGGIRLSPRLLTLLGSLGIGFELNPWLNDTLHQVEATTTI